MEVLGQFQPSWGGGGVKPSVGEGNLISSEATFFSQGEIYGI